jgi:hypothetical protein
MGGVKTISIIVAANIKGLEQGLGKANKSIAGFASNAARLGSMLSFGVTAPLAAMGKQAFDTFSKFEDGMAKVRAVTGASVDELKALEKEAKVLGSTTRYTALQFAELQLILGRKGFNPREINNMTKSVADLALATGEDLSLAAETVATSINAFNLESCEASRVANTLASAAANSSIQLSTFATAFGHAGASANAVGMDLEELAAMMGVLMDNGIKASKAGTGLRKIFMKLHEEGTDFTEVLDLATQGHLGLERAMKLAGVTSANQLLILANNKDEVARLTEEYKTNKGALKEMTDLMGKTTEQKVAIMNSAINAMNMEIGAMLAESLGPMIVKITELASSFQNLAPETKDMIIKVAGIAAVVGPLLMTLALFATAIGAVSTAFSVLGGIIPFSIAGMSAFGILLGESVVAAYASAGAMGALSAAFEVLTIAIAANPLGLLAVAIAAAGAAFWAFSSDVDSASTSVDEFNHKTKTSAERLAEINRQLDNYGKGTLELTKEELSGVVGTLTTKLEGLQSELKSLEKSKAFNELNNSVDKAGIAFETELTRIRSEIKKTTSQLSGYESALIRVNNLLNDGGSTPSGGWFDETFIETSKSIDDLKKDIEEGFGFESDDFGGVFEISEEPIKSFGENLSEGIQGWASKINGFFNTWGEGIGMIGDIWGQALQNQTIALENSHNRQLAAINKSQMTEEQKATAIQNLEEDTAEKRAAILRKQAIAEKAAAITSAIINGAQAMTKVSAQTGIATFAFSPIIAGLVAAQIATIAAQPIPAFADGGIVSGPTLGLMGEYSGAKANPEVIAPLDKLKSIIGGSESQTIIPDVRISGDDLLIVFDRAQRRKARR